MKLKKRVMKVSEMITESAMENTLRFRHDTHPKDDSLWNCLQVLAPSLESELWPALTRMIEHHGLSDSLIVRMESVATRAGYAIGIIAGLHFAGRHDLVKKFAEVYSANTVDGETWEYDLDGDSIMPGEQTSH